MYQGTEELDFLVLLLNALSEHLVLLGDGGIRHCLRVMVGVVANVPHTSRLLRYLPFELFIGDSATITANAVLITTLIVVDTSSIIFRQCHLRLEALIAIVRADKRIIRHQSIVQFSSALVITQNLFESEIRQSI